MKPVTSLQQDQQMIVLPASNVFLAKNNIGLFGALQEWEE
jgi:hypothetical protein